MGNWISNLWQQLFAQDKEVKLALVGLDGSGKTTIINKLINADFNTETAPTIGIDTKEIQIKNVNIKIFDLAGQESMRNVWKYYFSSTEGIIFVIDANRHDRLPDVKEELWRVLGDESAKKIPMLIYSNKQDLESPISNEDLLNELNISDVVKSEKNPKNKDLSGNLL